jgi:hypothetical protein
MNKNKYAAHIQEFVFVFVEKQIAKSLPHHPHTPTWKI